MIGYGAGYLALPPFGRMSKLRVLIADDHKTVLEGLKKVLSPEFEIAGASRTAASS